MTVEIAGAPRKFGRKVEHDPRSRAYGIVVNPAAPLEPRMWRSDAPVIDQGSIGMCTGAAMAQCVNAARTRDGATDGWLDVDDAVALYSRATVLDDFPGTYPPDDTGSSGLAVSKAAVEKGMIRSYRHAFGLAQLLVALQSGPVIVGTVWREGMCEPGPDGRLALSGDDLGGHEYTVIGCDLATVTILNSWGEGWGERGTARISWEDMSALLAAQGDVTVPIVGGAA
ncbi:MAG: hypothetical protein QM662_02390 [Gordonia sp. (in: high G+C Gram-positive bacteria)]